MNPIAAVLGIGLVCFLILYLSNSLNNDHEHLKRYIALVFIFTLLLIPKAMMDDRDYCEVIIANETLTGNVTSYQYSRQCFTNDNTTATSLYKIVNYMIYGVLVYAIMAFFWFAVKDFRNYRRKKKEW